VNNREPFFRQTVPSAPFAIAFIAFYALVSFGGPNHHVIAAEPAARVEQNEPEVHDLDARLQQFFVAKEKHARALARDFKINAAPEMWAYFNAGIEGDWDKTKSLWRGLSRRSGQYTTPATDESVRNLVWSPLLETELACECFNAMDAKFVESFARDTLKVIPPGAIYFGGTDPGRGVITAFVKSHADAEPFFVLTQNALADDLYLKFLDATFGKQIYIANKNDAQVAFEDYKADAERRLDEGKLKPGENVSRVDGKLEFSGVVSVMAVNGLIAKVIFDKNPRHEFYIEQSFFMDWMYPHLSPVGPIMKLNRAPLKEISGEALEADQKYWQRFTGKLLGDWLGQGTPVSAVCEFIDRVYRDVDLEGFKGDQDYVLSDRNHTPRRQFGKLRLDHASVYEWRWEHAKTEAEKSSMEKAGDLAFRQSLALNPDEPECVRRHVRWLLKLKRKADARRVLDTGSKLNPRSKRLSELQDELGE